MKFKILAVSVIVKCIHVFAVSLPFLTGVTSQIRMRCLFPGDTCTFIHVFLSNLILCRFEPVALFIVRRLAYISTVYVSHDLFSTYVIRKRHVETTKFDLPVGEKAFKVRV